MRPFRRIPLAPGLLLLAACGASQAQALRDPTQAPLLAPAADGASAPARPALDLLRGSDGRLRVLHDGRFLAVGQHINGAVITRITESEVWLKTDGVTQKWERYPAVTRRASPAASSSMPPTRRHAP